MLNSKTNTAAQYCNVDVNMLWSAVYFLVVYKFVHCTVFDVHSTVQYSTALYIAVQQFDRHVSRMPACMKKTDCEHCTARQGHLLLRSTVLYCTVHALHLHICMCCNRPAAGWSVLERRGSCGWHCEEKEHLEDCGHKNGPQSISRQRPAASGVARSNRTE